MTLRDTLPLASDSDPQPGQPQQPGSDVISAEPAPATSSPRDGAGVKPASSRCDRGSSVDFGGWPRASIVGWTPQCAAGLSQLERAKKKRRTPRRPPLLHSIGGEPLT